MIDSTKNKEKMCIRDRFMIEAKKLYKYVTCYNSSYSHKSTR